MRQVQIAALAAALVVLLCVALAQADFVGAPGSPYAANDDPYTVTPGNFNADSLADLAVVNGTTSTLQIFDQQAAGGFVQATGSPFAVGSGPNFAAVADFNGDGLEDVAVANFVGQSVSIELQQPNGSFHTDSTLDVSSDTGKPSAIATGDFNGDGKPDLVVAGFDSHNLVLYQHANTASAQFYPVSGIDTGGTQPRDIAVGDLDGVGGPDLAVTNSGSNTVAVLDDQPGGASFVEATGSPYAVGAAPQFVVVAPFDDDSRPDVAVSDSASNDVTVLDHQPDGTFAPQTGSPFAVGTQPDGLAAGDLSQSGREDLVSANAGSDSFTLLRNTGTTFTRAADVQVSPNTAIAPQGIATGNFNGDPFTDVALTSINTNPGLLHVFLNRPPPDATTVDASALATTSATLHGSVNPNGNDTTAYFEYGTTTSYGTRAPASGDLPIGADRDDHDVSRQVSGLEPGTTYHYRVVATNAAGTTDGDDATFTTPTPAPPTGTDTGTTPAPPTTPTSTLSGPPQAVLNAPSTVAAGASTTISGVGTTPATGLDYRFDLDGSGKFATDNGTSPSYNATFVQPGDVKIGLLVIDQYGRTDTVVQTVHVTSTPAYGLTMSPSKPSPGQTVTFRIRQLIDNPATLGKSTPVALPTGALSTFTFGDKRPVNGTVAGILVPGRAVSTTGTFTHVFTDPGIFNVHATVDNGHGSQTAVTFPVGVGKSTGPYQPAISTLSTTVDQGSCVAFGNASASQLSFDEAGAVTKRDENPVKLIPIVAPPNPATIVFGGTPDPINFNGALGGSFLSGSPLAQYLFNPASLALPAGRRAQTRQAEPTVSYTGQKTCQLWDEVQHPDLPANVAPYPAGGDAGWSKIPDCPNGLKFTTYSFQTALEPGTLIQDTLTTRHTWFSADKWDFGDGQKNASYQELPSYAEYHPYDKGGTFTVKLTSTFPKDLAHQAATWNQGCGSNPLNADKPDDRFDSKTVSVDLHVTQHYTRIKSRGLYMTSGGGYFTDSDVPGIYQTSGSIYLNTRRASNDPANPDDNINNADGILIVTPDDGNLKVNPDTGQIIGAAHMAWEGRGQNIALGPVPLNINGTPGLVIPQPGSDGTYDFGVVNNPPATLSSGAPPPPGAAFHINTAQVILRAGHGGLLNLNIHLPQPLGPDGGNSDEALTFDDPGAGRRATTRWEGQPAHALPRGLLDNVDVDLPPVELVPDVLGFAGGHLSHHIGADPPYQATGALDVLGIDIDMSPDSKYQGCPVSGGLGFFEDGGLDYAGAVARDLRIPIPNPPDPVPLTQLANPALSVMPATSTRPLDLFGCLSLEDYPSADTFTVTGCAGFLSAGSGKTVPAKQTIPFCADEKGNETFTLNDQNSQVLPNGAHRLKGLVVRATGTVGLGPDQYKVAQAYIEYRSDPFAVQFKGHFGDSFLDGHLQIGADLEGYFKSLDDWEIAGQGGVTQDIICVPFTSICPGANDAALVSSKGIGVCVTIFSIGIGGTVRFKPLGLVGHFPSCGLSDLKSDLGIQTRALPVYNGIRAAGDPVAQGAQVSTASVDLPGDTPYALIVARGTDKSPVVQVHDPDGKLVLDDNGQPVQGLPAPGAAPAPGDVSAQATEPTSVLPKKAPQGILHDDLTNFQDQNVDLRHTTMILVRAPKQGRYTITTKPGSSPITAISHSVAVATPQVAGGVVGTGADRMLSLQSKLPTGSTMTVSEEGSDLDHTITTVTPGAQVSSAHAHIARLTRHVAFKPALGPAGKRSLVATIAQDGIPIDRVVIGSYKAPKPPKTGKVHGLKTTLRGDKLKVSWQPAKNAKTYVVRLAFKHGRSQQQSVSAKQHRIVFDDALARLGVKVTVQAIGPLDDAGGAAVHHVAPAKVKRIKTFVL